MKTFEPSILFSFQLLTFFSVLWVGCGPSIPDPVKEAYAILPEKIDYNFDVQPILSDRCYACHGPDENARKGDFRLDIEEEAFRKLNSGNYAFVKGNLRKSEVFHRIVSDKPDYKMPPPDSKLELAPQEIAIITKWLEQGADWKAHWSFLPVKLPPVPRAHQEWTAFNAIDHFIQDQLVFSGLEPNPQADKERLLRRVTMDLTGLPPTMEEIDQFLGDSSPNAYEHVVERLLQSEAHAERLAMEWLDVARYADSHGVSFDGYQNMWPYRDWVINAFNKNMPFDQFVTKQVAGDLLPDPTEDDHLATAFYRLNPMEASQGSIDEEYRVEYVAERTATTGIAFLGLTIGCARCHDHKFDPISQKEFYQLSAFFNNTEEMGLGPTDQNRAPSLYLLKKQEKNSLDSLDQLIEKEGVQLQKTTAQLQQIGTFIHQLDTSKKIEGEIGYFPFEKLKKIKRKKKKRKPVETEEEKKKKKKKTETEKEKEKVEYEEVLVIDENKKSEATLGVTIKEGKKGAGLYFDDEYDYASLKKTGLFDHYDPFSFSAWIKAEPSEKGVIKTIVGNSGTFSSNYRGWEFALNGANQLSLRLVHRLPDNLIEVNTQSSVEYNQWTQIGFSYNGNGQAAGIAIFINGEKVPLKVKEDRLSRSIKPMHKYTGKIDTTALRVGRSYRLWTGDVGLFKGTIDEVRIFDRQLSQLEMASLGETDWSPAPATLAQEHLAIHNEKVKKSKNQLKSLRQAKLTLLDKANEVMILQDRKEVRKTYVLERGLYNVYGEEVTGSTPAQVLPFPEDYPKNRLGLAKWLTHRDNPLTARVIINRYWQMIFGRGIVKTTEDFGVQGDLPTHPELLDWLAAEFMDSQWDLRKILKLMVLSNTYRQSSFADKEKMEVDPTNHYYARSNSYRWQAEFIRDNALAASGLLKDTIGGPSVKPYQPDGLWKELGYFSFTLAKYKPDTTDNLYRRSLYTFVRRFAPNPFMINFDASNREICATRRINTNTPLQALNLLNDPQFIEASRFLSERMQKESSERLEDQLLYGYRLATGVSPSTNILSVLKEQYDHAFQHFEQNPLLADSLLQVGKKTRDLQLDKTRTAALTLVANTIFNYDESYMKR